MNNYPISVLTPLGMVPAMHPGMVSAYVSTTEPIEFGPMEQYAGEMKGERFDAVLNMGELPELVYETDPGSASDYGITVNGRRYDVYSARPFLPDSGLRLVKDAQSSIRHLGLGDIGWREALRTSVMHERGRTWWDSAFKMIGRQLRHLPPCGTMIDNILHLQLPPRIAGGLEAEFDQLFASAAMFGHLRGLSLDRSFGGGAMLTVDTAELDSSAAIVSPVITRSTQLIAAAAKAGRLVVLGRGSLDVTSPEYLRALEAPEPHLVATDQLQENSLGAFIPGVLHFLSYARRMPHFLGVIGDRYPEGTFVPRELSVETMGHLVERP